LLPPLPYNEITDSIDPFLLIDDKVDQSQPVLDTSAVFLQDLRNPGALAIGGNRAIYYAAGRDASDTLYILEDFDRFNRPGANVGDAHNRVLVSGYGTIADIAASGSSYVYFANASDFLIQFSLNARSTRLIDLSDLGDVTAITIDSEGYVYAAINNGGAGSIYKVDFTYQKVNKTKVNTGSAMPAITDLAIDNNKNLLFTSSDKLYQLASPSYSYDSAFTLVDASDDLPFVACDASGGIYYVEDDYPAQLVKYLRPDYTHAWGKNKYMVRTVTTAKLAGFDVGAQYDLAITTSDTNKLRGFTGSRSDPAKTDSDSDGRLDGYGDPDDPYDGELDYGFTFTVNRVGMSSTTLYPKPTFPTMADSDSDGCPDGIETVQAYNVKVKTLTGSSTIQNIRSDPSRYDTDSDGLSDGIERNFTDALNRDTDQDGINDSVEDKNRNGRVESTETSPVTADSDGDGLADGWKDYGNDGVFGTHDPGEMNAIRDLGEYPEAVGEDFNFSGTNDANEPSPLRWDSDGDTLSDGTEVTYLLSIPYVHYHDADGDGVVDVLERDADADGLADNVENSDGDGTYDATESNPYLYDSDLDGLPDGVEPSPFKDIDIDEDIDINARDQDSNDDETNDFYQTFVLFRTTAVDSNSDGKLDFGADTDIATFNYDDPDIYYLNGSLTKYCYQQTTTLPDGCTDISVHFNGGNPVVLRTPDNRSLYLKAGSPYKIYIHSSGDQYFEYVGNGALSISNSLHVYWVNAHDNEVANRQIAIDTRLATGEDTDCDGLRNSIDPNGTDRDTDDDGIPDGTDPNITNADCDGDGLPDGLETGVTSTVPGIGTAVDGTNISSTFTWTVNGFNVVVHNFTIDADPTTVTDPLNADTDWDDINDGVEDCDMTNLSTGDHTLVSTDLNGKFDGFAKSETNPLDIDSDDDGITDGTEDTNHNGMWDWNNQTFTGDTCAWRFDSDGDNLGDGLEIGKHLWNITLDTNTSIFRPDALFTTTTNPLAVDTDCDGVPDGYIDGWTMTSSGSLGKYNVPDMEFQFGEGEDRNLNGMYDAGETDPESKDSDGDRLADGWDILSSDPISGLFTLDTSGVRRYWGELNSSTHLLGTRSGANVYQTNTTDPTNRDSDGDGLVDGNIELNGLPCELVTSHNNISQTMFTDPSMMDTDSDGLSDGLEISGWEVHILKESTKQEVINWTVHSNPTVIDTDSDGLKDYYEFENQSDPFKTDTDGDYILDIDESQGELTQIDGKPPTYIKWDGSYVHVSIFNTYGSEYEGIISTSGTVTVTVQVKDGAGINYVEACLQGEPKQKRFLGGATCQEVVFAFECDKDRYLATGWDLWVNATDRNGNGNRTKTMHVDSVWQTIQKMAEAGFMAFVNAIGKFISALCDWIWNLIKQMIDAIVSPILEIIQLLFNPVFQELNNIIDSIGTCEKGRHYDDEFNTPGHAGLEHKAWKIFFNKLFLIFSMLSIITTIMVVLEVLLSAIGIGIAIGIIAGIIVGAILISAVVQFAIDVTSINKQHLPGECGTEPDDRLEKYLDNTEKNEDALLGMILSAIGYQVELFITNVFSPRGLVLVMLSVLVLMATDVFGITGLALTACNILSAILLAIGLWNLVFNSWDIVFRTMSRFYLITSVFATVCAGIALTFEVYSNAELDKY